MVKCKELGADNIQVPIVVRTEDGDTFVSEWKDGLYFGKMTFYYEDGRVINRVSENASLISYKNVSKEPDCVFYAIDGKPVKALAENWMDYVE